MNLQHKLTLRKKCPYLELFWSVFSRIQTEYGEIRSTSPCSVRTWENKDQSNSEYRHFLLSVKLLTNARTGNTGLHPKTLIKGAEDFIFDSIRGHKRVTLAQINSLRNVRNIINLIQHPEKLTNQW